MEEFFWFYLYESLLSLIKWKASSVYLNLCTNKSWVKIEAITQAEFTSSAMETRSGAFVVTWMDLTHFPVVSIVEFETLNK